MNSWYEDEDVIQKELIRRLEKQEGQESFIWSVFDMTVAFERTSQS